MKDTLMNFRESQLLGIKDAAELLGIAETTLRQWLCSGKFPYVKAGRRTLIAAQDLTDFVQANRVAAKNRLTSGFKKELKDDLGAG